MTTLQIIATVLLCLPVFIVCSRLFGDMVFYIGDGEYSSSYSTAKVWIYGVLLMLGFLAIIGGGLLLILAMSGKFG